MIAGFRKVLDCLLRRPAGQGLAAPGGPGQEAERLGDAYLRSQGLRILARNFRCKGGEIDLIAEHAQIVVFVEVRLRSHVDFGGAAASITPAKQRRVILAARHWLQTAGRPYSRRPCRFDALLLDGLAATRIQWLQAAFTPDRL